MENTTKALIEHLVSVTTSDRTTQPSSSLGGERATRASNASCGEGLPLTDGLQIEGRKGNVT